MAELPYMSLNVSDVRARISEMPSDARGAYLSLLLAMWAHDGFITDDPILLARIGGCGIKRWRTLAPVVTAGMTSSGGLISDPTLLTILDLTKTKRKAKSVAARNAWDLRKSLKTIERANGNAPVLHMQPTWNQNQNPPITSSLTRSAKQPPMKEDFEREIGLLVHKAGLSYAKAQKRLENWLGTIENNTDLLKTMIWEAERRGLKGVQFHEMVAGQVRAEIARIAPPLPKLFGPRKIG